MNIFISLPKLCFIDICSNESMNNKMQKVYLFPQQTVVPRFKRITTERKLQTLEILSWASITIAVNIKSRIAGFANKPHQSKTANKYRQWRLGAIFKNSYSESVALCCLATSFLTFRKAEANSDCCCETAFAVNNKQPVLGKFLMRYCYPLFMQILCAIHQS